MAVVELNTKAPDFNLQDQKGIEISLSSFHSKKNIILVLNRGFV